MSGEWTIDVCGSRGSVPVHGPDFHMFGGGTSCYVFRRGDYALIVDCGSGLCRAGKILQGCRRVDIALTHLHYDHLIGILAYNVLPAGAAIRFAGNFDRWFGADTINEFFREPFWPVVPTIGDTYQVSPMHPVRLYEDKEAYLTLTLFDAPHPNEAANLRIDTEEGSVAVLFDYEHTQQPNPACMRGCAMLIYDGMYTREEYESHRGWGHSYWQKGVELSDSYEIPRLVITHHAPMRTDAQLMQMEKEACAVRSGLVFARAGDVYQIARDSFKRICEGRQPGFAAEVTRRSSETAAYVM